MPVLARYPAGRTYPLISDALDLPKAFGPYTLLRRLAVGGMAEVYVAKTKGIGGFEKLIAIKVIHPRFSEDDHFIQMLVEEAKIAVQLSHVNIAQTFDLGCIEDTYYIAMEFVEGADVYRVGRRAKDKKVRLPIDICIYVCAEICAGLGYAHRKRDSEGQSLGIVHRDISPQNVLVSHAGEVKLVDFGIAKAALRGGQTEVGVIKGKYYYMSPEQAWGDPVDQRSDLFSAGIVLHELLTGEMVYTENNVPALLDKVRKAEIPSPRLKRPKISPKLESIMMKAVAKEPSDRYQSAHAFAQDLTEVLYKGNPTFTASRLAQLMGTLFPEQVKRHSQILELPPEDFEREPSVPPAKPLPKEVSLPAMSRAEFLPPKEASVVFDLGDADEDEDESTRNDILPFRRRKTTGTGPGLHTPAPPADPYAQFGGGADPGDWEDETFLKGKSEWEESTFIEEDGDAFRDAHGMIKSLRGAAPASNADLEGEMTVATMNPLALMANSVSDRTALGAPAFPDDDEEEPRTAMDAPAFHMPPKAFPKPGGAKPPSVPPPGALPPRRIPPPASLKQPPVPKLDPPTLDEPAPPMSPAPPIPRPPQPAAVVGAPHVLPPDAKEELEPERTMALSEEGLAMAPVARPAAPLAGPSSAGIRLGPAADRFFEAAPSAAEPFDPFGGVAVNADPSVAPLADPFSVPPPADPFEASPSPTGEMAAELGKPRPIRWIAAAVLVAIMISGIVAAGAWYASRPEPTSLTLITTPEGANVRLDDTELPHQTPVTLNDLASGGSVELTLTRTGHESRTDTFVLREGENRRVYHLNPIRVTLRITTEPEGAQVWVDDVLRGSSPLEIAGLSNDEELAIRCTLHGRQALRIYTVGEEPHQEIAVPLPAPPPAEE